MSLVGQTLLHYRIRDAIGGGGMGVVYAADDTKLHRPVALKILPADVAASPDRLERFRREARAVAALNHPNVVTIYSVEEAAGIHFLTMELVEGKTLVDLIPSQGMPIRELSKIALPLVDAVAAAHERGIVHRDLKPSNVMVTSDGRVKVLDFGLAKLRADADAATGIASAVTTDPLTAPHAVLGTAAYMSPEQAEGRAIDHRSDIFSLGIVLYEMTTGRRPFGGDTSMSIISSILKDTPSPPSELNPALPAEYDRIIRRCLAKDPARRYQHAVDLRNDLEDLQHTIVADERPQPRRPWTRTERIAAVAVALAAGASASYFAWSRVRSARADAAPNAQFTQLTSLPGAELFPSLSPDAKWIVYTGDAAGNRDIYLQSVGGNNPVNLTGDSPDEDEEPAFSPDGERIVFRSSRDGGGLFVMGRTGESVTRVTRAGFNPSWSPDGASLLFTSAKMELKPQNSIGPSELWTVSAKGGEPRRVAPLDLKGDIVQPVWSPHTRRIAFGLQLGPQRNTDIWTARVNDGGGGQLTLDRTVGVTQDPAIDWNPVWAPDGTHLYFASTRGGSMNLWRVAIDENTGVTRGVPEQMTAPAPFAAHITIAADGRHIAYTSVLMTQNVQKMPMDPVAGKPVDSPIDVTTGSRLWSSPDPSPDGQMVAFYSQEPEGHMHVIRNDGTGIRALTNDAFIDRVPRWSPDGKWIAWFSTRSGATLQLWKIRLDGSDLQQMTELRNAAYFAWSPDGSRVAVTESGSAIADPRLCIFDPARRWADQQPELMPLPDVRVSTTAWSPDGAQLAMQVLPGGAGVGVYSLRSKTLRRLTEYGEWPTWLPDSRRMLFVSEGKYFVVVDTVTGAAQKVYSSTRDVIGPPRLTRDGRMAFFTRRVNQADVWLATLR